jgi:NAD(P)H-flavin reductase/ferredoxin
MTRKCTVSINDEDISVLAGERILDSALRQGLDMPYDCREGRCGTCVIKVEEGRVLGGETGRFGYVRACQAHVLTDVVAVIDDTGISETSKGRVVDINPLSRDVCELAVALEKPLPFRPGQYVNLTFAGLPPRSYSPTAPLGQQEARPDLLYFHIRQFPGGAFSGQIGKRIGLGSSLNLEGPFGSAHLRHDGSGRLVLVSGGTGFAPIWAIAQAALKEDPEREIVMVIGARESQDLYMAKAIKRLAGLPNVNLKITVDNGATQYLSIKVGKPTEHIGKLKASDTVHVAGPPPLVSAVEASAEPVGCEVFADAFAPAVQSGGPLRRIWGLGLFNRGMEDKQAASVTPPQSVS